MFQTKRVEITDTRILHLRKSGYRRLLGGGSRRRFPGADCSAMNSCGRELNQHRYPNQRRYPGQGRYPNQGGGPKRDQKGRDRRQDQQSRDREQSRMIFFDCSRRTVCELLSPAVVPFAEGEKLKSKYVDIPGRHLCGGAAVSAPGAPAERQRGYRGPEEGPWNKKDPRDRRRTYRRRR